PEATLAGAQRMLLVPPREGDRPLAATTTAADGSFDLRVAADGGMVIVSSAGYASRQLPFAAATADAATIALWQMRHLTGRVRTQPDEPPPPLDLLLVAVGWPSSGAWPAHTDATGAFQAEVAAASVQVQCRTPGWTVTRRHGNRIELATLDTRKGGTVY